MGNLLRFSERLGFERVRSIYTAREIARQFGLSLRLVRRWTQEGLIQTAAGDPDSAVAYDFRALTVFRRVRELRNQGLSIKQIEAELHGQLNLFPDAEGRLIPLPARLTPFEEALRLHECGSPRAADSYTKAIEKDDYAADAYCNLGILEFEAGDIAGAFNRFTSALKHDPRHFEAHFNLAHLYFEAGDLRLARLHYELAAVIEPSFPDLYFNLGLVHAMANELEAALQTLKTARDLAPDDDREKVEELLSSIEHVVQSTSETPT